jgi:hypothetical protein
VHAIYWIAMKARQKKRKVNPAEYRTLLKLLGKWRCVSIVNIARMHCTSYYYISRETGFNIKYHFSVVVNSLATCCDVIWRNPGHFRSFRIRPSPAGPVLKLLKIWPEQCGLEWSGYIQYMPYLVSWRHRLCSTINAVPVIRDSSERRLVAVYFRIWFFIKIPVSSYFF